MRVQDYTRLKEAKLQLALPEEVLEQMRRFEVMLILCNRLGVTNYEKVREDLIACTEGFPPQLVAFTENQIIAMLTEELERRAEEERVQAHIEKARMN